MSFTTKQAAMIVGFSSEHILRQIRKGDLKAVGQQGRGGYHISKIELERWWKSQGGGQLFEEQVAT